MESEKMHDAKLVYVFEYYRHLRTKHEAAAIRHLWVTAEENQGCTGAEAQLRAHLLNIAVIDDLSKTENLEVPQIEGRMADRLLGLSDDPEVLRLAACGYQAFVRQTGQRILEQHRDQLALNCCPKCGGVARTPTARQCRFCWHDWHTS